MIYGLPKELEVNGTYWKIRSDFRDVMKIVFAMNDPNLKDNEKVYIVLFILYEDFDEMKEYDYEAALKAGMDFINHGSSGKRGKDVKLVDFEQDENLLIPAVNRVAGFEVRDCEYMHWWTFIGYFMEIGECMYSQVLNIRSKRAKSKNLEKWELEFFNSNKDLILIKEKLSDEEQEEYDLINSLIQ